MKSQTLLGFDFGSKSIGVAVGSTQSGLAQPLTAVRNGDWDSIGKLIAEWQPDALVVGLPLNMDASENPRTAQARKFGDRLQGRYNLPVHRVDERLTTYAAKTQLNEGRQHKADLDKRAAQTILQSYLDDPSRSHT